ncbi:MAG: TIGR01459 family HAD-type hydrolase, partial [Pseudomonadota bacterium]
MHNLEQGKFKKMSNPTFINKLSKVAEDHDLFIVDLWGVIHDGQNLYPGVKECLEKFRDAGKKIIFLSNAPRRSSEVAKALLNMGIGEDLYQKIVTSGEAFYDCLATPEPSTLKPQGKNYFFIGLEKDANIIADLDYVKQDNIEDAEFVILAHSYVDNQPLDQLMPLLEKAKAKNLPVYCINPDKEVVRLNGDEVYCAGRLAEEYKNLGGEVIYFGKPHKAVYDAAFKAGEVADPNKVLAIGDNRVTDIAGGNNAGIKNVLVTGGILKGSDQEGCRQLFDQHNIKPTFVIEGFAW